MSSNDIQSRLGRLEKVELREVWAKEAADFTPWLAGNENIVLLGETIGMDLEVETTEKGVGPFSADILCKETTTDHWVLIENQLERTDHTHLGQLITYAAGLNAVTIVWIAQRFTDEHRAALDWLNEKTDEGLQFFGLELELWRIGNSAIAPKFNVASSPNDWTKSMTQRAKSVEAGALTPAKELQLEFWTAFREYVDQHGAQFTPTKALPQTWMSIAIGRTGFRLHAIASTWVQEAKSDSQHALRAELELYDHDAKAYYAQLLAMKDQVESELGETLTWHNADSTKSCRVFLMQLVDLNDRGRWDEYHEWLRTKLNLLRRVFGPLVKSLKADPELATLEQSNP